MPETGKTSIKIAMLGHKRVPSREGGVEIVVEELSSRMVESGYDVTCFNRRGHHVSGKEFDSENLRSYKGINIKTVPTIDKCGLSAMSSSFFAAVKVAFGKFNIAHFHAEGPCAMLWLPKLFGKKCYATIHGLDHQRAKWGKFASLYILLGEKCAVRFADEIIVLSRNLQKYFKDKYGRETVFIPNGVDRPENIEVDEINKKFGLEKEKYILFLGRIVPEKGLKYLVEAFKNVKTDKKLVIAGGASDTDTFFNELKTEAKSDDRIVFTGFVEGKVLQELYSNAYLYVLPSDLEGMPLSLLEAMSYGNCCLTSDIPECAEVIERSGVTFSKGNITELASKLQMLCDEEVTVKTFKSKSSDYICEKYSWKKVVEETLKVYGMYEDISSSTDLWEEKDEDFAHK